MHRHECGCGLWLEFETVQLCPFCQVAGVLYHREAVARHLLCIRRNPESWAHMARSAGLPTLVGEMLRSHGETPLEKLCYCMGCY